MPAHPLPRSRRPRRPLVAADPSPPARSTSLEPAGAPSGDAEPPHRRTGDHATSAITASRRGPPSHPGGRHARAPGSPALPAVSGPATGAFGSGGLALPGLSPGLAAAAAGDAGALGAAPAGCRRPAAQAAVPRPPVLPAPGTRRRRRHRPCRTRGARRPDAGRSAAAPRPGAPLSAVENDADDDGHPEDRPAVRGARSGERPVAAPSPRRSARNRRAWPRPGGRTTGRRSARPGRRHRADRAPCRRSADAARVPTARHGDDRARPDTPTRRSVRTHRPGETPR